MTGCSGFLSLEVDSAGRSYPSRKADLSLIFDSATEVKRLNAFTAKSLDGQIQHKLSSS